MIPKDKLSKKAKKELDSASRNDWNGINPMTKVIPDKKKQKSKRACKDWKE